MQFEHKLEETKPNGSHEVATFLKYHVPLAEALILIRELKGMK